MDQPRLIIDSGRELPLDKSLITIGRASDNTVPFEGDSNVSRYHAEIEKRVDEFWIIDLGSFNGTTINGEKLDGERFLNDGDVLVFGGTSKIEVAFYKQKPEEKEEEVAPEIEPELPDEPEAEFPDALPPAQKSKIPLMLIVAALAVGLAVVCVTAAGMYYLTREDPVCVAQAKIVSPERGDTIKDPTKIELEISGEECVSEVSYTIEGKEFARVKEPPFSSTIEPNDFPEFSDGLNRNLKVILYDENGIEINQSNEIAFFIDTIEVATPTETPTPGAESNPPNGDPKGTQTDIPQGSIKETIAMTGNVVNQFSGNFEYKTANPDFLREVRKATTKYVSEGYFERASKYRDEINVAFIRERNLDPPLGYILAMSRSAFLPKNNAEGTGLWRMSNDFVTARAYDGLCGEETIASASQNCAAKASAHYLKDLILNVFEGDVVYGIAAFGMTPQEADAWKASLPQDRADFWNVIKSPSQRQEVANFFAAAMVAENPQKFGLKKDRPLSELYSVFMK